MEWLQSINKSIRYIEDNLTNEISVEDVANQVFSSNSNFQRIFNLIAGITIGEYIRNRRLSLAGQDLLFTNSKVIDVAMKYQYDTSESFSKAFSRFHGISPSNVKRHSNQLKFFYPLTINISIQGGFSMVYKLADEFHWNTLEEQKSESLSDSEKYQKIIGWAWKAREKNPNVFDTLIEWLLDDSEWSNDKLIENEQILMQGVLGRFKEQNAQLRTYLSELKSSEIVNEIIFHVLEQFDNELSGNIHDKELQKVVVQMFTDFSIMSDPNIRKQIAGSKTGPLGTDHADLYGYINYLKDYDAKVQWALFMPAEAKRQQNGFKIESFEYKKMPAMRFLGQESDDLANIETRRELFRTLDAMEEYRSGFDYDILFMHHYGLGIDVGSWHGIWGRFMKADAPVPEGFLSFDFVPYNDGKTGLPYISQFAYATFSGDLEAMHKREGYDSDAMYDVTRNTMLGQGVTIPYPDKYWTAEVFLDGCDNYSTAYMFSAEL